MKMKIQRKKNSKPVRFGCLESGQIFEYHNRLMIKMSASEDDDAFDIEYHITVILHEDIMVIPINATLTIEY